MVNYVAIMTLLVGASLLSIGWLGLSLKRPLKIVPEGWGLTLMGLGFLTGLLGLLMTVTWPLATRPHMGILFGNIPMILGIFVLLAGAFMYWRWRTNVATRKNDDEAHAYLRQVLQPVSVVLVAAGVGLVALLFVIGNYTIFGAPPPIEPIKPWFAETFGRWLENGFVSVLIYGAGAAAVLLAPIGFRNLGGKVFRTACVLLVIAGVSAILYGALNLYTHIGLSEAAAAL